MKIKLLLLILYVVTAILYLFEDQLNISHIQYSAIYIIFPLIALLTGGIVVKKFGIDNKRGQNLFLLTLGIFFWFLGESIWLFLEYLEKDPFPSVADIAYIIAYPLLLIGLVKEVTLGKIKWTTKSLLLTSLPVLFLALITLYFGVYYAYDSEATQAENIVSIFYGVGDLILVFILFYLLNLSNYYKGGKLKIIWMYFSLGVVATLFADILFAIYYDEYEAWEDYYYLIDLVWLAGYSFFALGFLEFNTYIDKHLKSVKAKMNKQ